MAERVKTASRLISAVQLGSIRLVEVAAKSIIRSPGDVEDVRFSVTPHAKVPDLPRDGAFYVLASFELQVVANGQETPIVTMEATFELKYSLPADFESVTQEELAAFAEVNAIFNAWPYWREYIQSTFVRMNLPPVALPVFRLSDHMVAGEEKEGK
jgi:hypothetical protein